MPGSQNKTSDGMSRGDARSEEHFENPSGDQVVNPGQFQPLRLHPNHIAGSHRREKARTAITASFSPTGIPGLRVSHFVRFFFVSRAGPCITQIVLRLSDGPIGGPGGASGRGF